MAFLQIMRHVARFASNMTYDSNGDLGLRGEFFLAGRSVWGRETADSVRLGWVALTPWIKS